MPSEREVVSSNATLALFGGARRKSWMTGNGTPVRPTPRTNPYRTMAPQISIAQKSSATVLPSPAPSDEPSPILANALVHNHLAQTDNQTVAFGDENHRPSTISNPQHFGDGHSTARQAGTDVGETRQTTRLQFLNSSSTDTLSPPMVLRNTPDSNESRLGQSTDMQDVQVRQLPAEARPRFAQQTQASGLQNLSSLPVSQQFHEIPPISIAPTSLMNTRIRQLPSPTQTNASSPPAATDVPLPPNVLQHTQSYPSPGSTVPAPPNPPKRQRTQPPIMFSLKPKVALIHQQIASIGGAGNLNSNLEGPRFRLLEEACNNEDIFYIALHQIFCIWDIPNPTQVQNIPNFPNTDILLRAFKILGQLIRENEGLAPNHKRWFATFPSPLPDLLGSSEPYRKTVSDIGVFLGKLVVDWGLLSRDCAMRRYPPLVDELISRMGLLSPTLQRIVFTAVRRNLGVADDSVGQAMEQLFARDQKEHTAIVSRYNTANPPTERGVLERRQRLSADYANLMSQHVLSRRSSGSMMSNPSPRNPMSVVPSSGQPNPASPTTITQGTQPEVVHGARQQLSNNLTGRWQSSNQTPPVRAGSTSSPNLASLAIAGQSPMLNGQQLQTGTSSPSVLQSHTMQSPVQMQQGFTPVVRSNGSAQNSAQIPTAGMIFQTPYQSFVPGAPPATAMQNGQYQNVQYPMQVPTTGPQSAPIQAQHLAQQQRLQQQTQRAGRQPLRQQQNPNLQRQQHAMMLHQHQMQHVINLNRNISMPQLQIGNASSIGTRQVGSTRNISNGQTPHVSNIQPGGQAITPASNNIARRSHPLNRPFIPRPDMVPVPQQINPDMTALHQAHLRSPVLTVPNMFSNSQNDKSHRYYQIVQGFALLPTKLVLHNPVMDVLFTVSSDELNRLPQDVSTEPGKLATRQLDSGKLQYRLRCIQTRPEVTKCLEPDWVISETAWPDSIFLKFEEYPLEPRRKAQHGKDLPIDLTQFVLRKGMGNLHIRISSPQWSKKKDHAYFIAVEKIVTLQHSEILQACHERQGIPAKDTLASIKNSLAPKEDEDDDLAMVPGDLIVSLADPFTARIFVVPVRGRSCQHRECFDLEVFLATRNSKPKRPQQPCMVDVWKCPLCGRDARPDSLQVDEFFANVRTELEKQIKLDVKAILISPDGSWRAKPEPQPEKRRAPYDDDPTDDEEDGLTEQKAAEAGKRSVVEVIELDDDDD